MRKKYKDAAYLIMVIISGIAMLFVGLVYSGFLFDRTHRKDARLRAHNEIVRLQSQKDQLLSDNERLLEQNEAYQVIIDNLSEDFLSRLSDDSLQVEVQRMRVLSGLTDVEGPGIIVQLNDANIDYSYESFDIIHSQDIQHIIALLINAGATAIEVNGQRLINTTSITCVGPTVRINQQRFPAPFVISAICNPDVAYDILINNARIQNRQDNNVLIEFSVSEHLIIKAYNNSNDIFAIGNEMEAFSK